MNQIETLNTFSEDLQAELNKRSKSTDLVKTRSPFLRFTTGANMSQLQERFGERFRSDFSEYIGYKFFSVGLHGWDNKSYKESDLYGQRSQNGLMVGLTYKRNEQKVVYTKSPETNRNYPPPGILKAKVERLRNGNVLKFTIDFVCYTQQQLEILDIAAFSPGMTCILEWGSTESTRTGSSRFVKMLDFTDILGITDTIKRVKEGSRSSFIEEWCKPNNYNYDFAVANIANVSTVLENNAYIVTVTAYGVADNIMYISAYATSNPQTTSSALSNISGEILSSAREYFKVNGKFTRLLERSVDKKEVIKFSDPMDVRRIRDPIPASSGLLEESVGLEDVYFIKLDYFINYFLNNPDDGLITLINASLKDGDKLKSIIYHPPDRSEIASAGRFFTTTPRATTASVGRGRLYAGTDPVAFPPESPRTNVEAGNFFVPLGVERASNDSRDEQYVGYNEYLRSIDPDVMILYNPEAIRLDENNLTILETLRQNFRNTNVSPEIEELVLRKLEAFPMINYQSDNASGYTSMVDGIWVNSRAIQAAFLGARTIYEGIESLLLKMNSATENYWDLKLHFDDDLQSFRIIDDNLRISPSRDQNIYVFNKKLTNVDGGVLGPDVLDISVQTDYPRLMFSQLAIAGINNLPSLPETANAGLLQNKNLEDLFSPPGVQIEEDAETAERDNRLRFGDTLPDFIVGRLYTNSPESISNSRRATINQLLSTLESNGVLDDDIRSLIIEIYQKDSLLSRQEAAYYKNKIDQFNLTRVQLASLSEILSLRSRAIITRLKNDEIEFYRTNTLENIRTIDSRYRVQDEAARIKDAMSSTIVIVRDSITADRDRLLRRVKDSTLPVTARTTENDSFRTFVEIETRGGGG
jgi:hypothetical protein